MAIGRPKIYIKKNSGPKTEPCGTPHFILVHFETEFELRYVLVM
jgi:hypothetical protein